MSLAIAATVFSVIFLAELGAVLLLRGRDLDGLRRLALSCEVQPERRDIASKRARVQLPGTRLAPFAGRQSCPHAPRPH